MLSNNDRQTRELLSSDRPEDTSNRIFSDAYPKPIKRDWVLLLGHFAFALCGLLVLPFRPGVGIVAIAWGGSCAFLFAFIIVKKAFFNRSALLRVKIVGVVLDQAIMCFPVGRGRMAYRPWRLFDHPWLEFRA